MTEPREFLTGAKAEEFAAVDGLMVRIWRCVNESP